MGFLVRSGVRKIINSKFPFHLLFCLLAFSANAGQYEIRLESADGKLTILLGTLEMKPSNGGWGYKLNLNEAQFGDYFLSMRPFKCMSDNINMLCYLSYPYQLARHIDKADLVNLEYDLLFIRRKATDYGINPWNGLYYRLRWESDKIIGEGHEVDLDLLAVPPENDDLRPINDEDLHAVDAGQLWLPKMLVRPLN